MGSLAYRTVGIYTAAQAGIFGPRSWSSLINGIRSGSRNAVAILRQSILSSLIGSSTFLLPAGK